MPFKKFVHLHVHSEYSLLDGACQLDALIKQAKALHMPALALTDHGVLYGAIDFYHRCLKHGIKPIIGMEAYVAPGSRLDRSSDHGMRDAAHHLVLLAKDFEGYQNLVALSSIGFLQGYYYRPRIDKDVLAKHSRGLIGLSACLKGEIPQLLQKNELPLARQVAEEFDQLFGSGHFYLELMDQQLPNQGLINRGLIDIAAQSGIPLVVTNDVHYIKREDALAQEVLMCLSTGKTLDDDGHMQLPTQEFYLKSGDEMEALFQEHPDAGYHTTAIANQCNLELPSGRIQLPHYPIPQEEQTAFDNHPATKHSQDLDGYLAYRCQLGLKRCYQEVSSAVDERLQQELQVIKNMGYAAYFLIVWDFIEYAKKNNVPVGPGRGSVAGSLVAYLLGITEIDPIKYDLIFERFLNPERVTMPDIDVDFSDIGREKVISYVTEKYGQENVAQIITFGTMAARAAIRDVGRVLSLSFDKVDKLAKLIPFGPDMTIDRALENVTELRDQASQDDQVRKLIAIAKTLEGQVRHASTHAAGIVIARDPLLELVPLCHTKQTRSAESSSHELPNTLMTQYSMEPLERLGLLKMDFLGLRTLTVIDETIRSIQAVEQVKLELKQLRFDDEATYEILGQGQTDGVFQLESSGMRDLLKRLKPKSLEEICALIALYRPGPMAMIDDYINRKQGRQQISYPHPEVGSILKETFGTIVYQEQVMQIAVKLGGFTYGQADILRRAMGKKNRDLIEQQRDRFIQGATKKKIETDLAERIFDLMAKFGEYGFNKSHSLAYAVLAYQTAYLKANYPLHFMAAMLSSEMQHTEKIANYIKTFNYQGSLVAKPDINASGDQFQVSHQQIQFGLAAIKNVGVNAAKMIVQERTANGSFSSLDNFCERLDLRTINQRVVESLIKAGAFDRLSDSRQKLLQRLGSTLNRAQKMQEEKAQGQMAMFDNITMDTPQDHFVPSAGETQKERLAGEREVLGFYLSGHPLAAYQELLQTFNTTSIGQLNQLEEGQAVTMGGAILGLKHSTTKRKEPMLRFTMENLDGMIEVIVWPDLLGSHKRFLQKDEMIFVLGRLDRSGDESKLIAVDIVPLNQAYEQLSKKVQLTVHRTMGQEQLELLQQIISRHSGHTPVILKIQSEHHGYVIEHLPERFNVRVSQAFIEEISNIIAAQDIQVRSN